MTTAKRSLADLIRSREADTEQAALRKQFLERPPRVWLEADKIFGPLKIDKVRKL